MHCLAEVVGLLPDNTVGLVVGLTFLCSLYVVVCVLPLDTARLLLAAHYSVMLFLDAC